MTTLTELRLRNQLLLQPPFDAPQQVVEWMGAVQAQDYRMAKWAVGCRTASTDATQIEAALNRGDILRTHLLRPTWHFVSSKDLRWMLSLTADRIRAANDSYARGTDAALDSKSIHRYMNVMHIDGIAANAGIDLAVAQDRDIEPVMRVGPDIEIRSVVFQ